ncbi:choline dehydrogenase [Allobranchiibius sp. CTAmp26]|uniref:choline dehydrogenase n=1 Tax=Allobranchiibius sp. CTAmp26 TaxID=2815214 RepID=UPI001AA12E12|nr:choline dehydrogenase [Allobranchiibius sp. CTAmp26]MBO1754444.1 choline dehydrogenase [Allobranchiibius sp. CTAmp26]
MGRRRATPDVGAGAGFDTVIVGAGSAGCVLADRLSADPSHRVLVLESGRMDWKFDILTHMPNAPVPTGSDSYAWRYLSEPEPGLDGRRLVHSRGKMVGGSSSINAMIFLRGNPMDYDRWATLPGMQGWDWAHCLPYFMRMEDATATGSDDPRRGRNGPIVLQRGDPDHPLNAAFLRAAAECGHEVIDDINGYRQEGYGVLDRNTSAGSRCSAADGYLRPALSRPNLDLVTRAFVTRVLFEGTRAVGVEYRAGDRLHTVYADEVILSGGVFNSPQVLQLSGVGNAEELSALDIPVVQHLPGVGQNLQDHLEAWVQFHCDSPVSEQPHHHHRLRHAPRMVTHWLYNRGGPGASNHHEVGGFSRSRTDTAYPDIMCHLLPSLREVSGVPQSGHGFEMHVGPMLSKATGHVKTVSRNPATRPAIRFNYLTAPEDQREWLAAMRVARDIGRSPAMKELGVYELAPGEFLTSDRDVLAWVRRNVSSALHPSCSCKMGTDEMSVVDPDTLRVHGLDGIRVVDASVLPVIPNSNIYAPVMMVAERAADMITGADPLPASDLTYHRAEVSPDVSAETETVRDQAG